MGPLRADEKAERKRHGRVYTPEPLARFLARRALEALATGPAGRAKDRGLVALDPACGDGALLAALAAEAPARLFHELHGIDVDPSAVARARERLGSRATVARGDFLGRGGPRAPVDLLLANPPYVRTQTLGAERAATLRRRYALVGRFDLLHAFVAAARPALADGGVLAFLGSNRFLSTRAGAGPRRVLEERFEVLEVVDLGDTRPFDAAVLPVLVVARAGGGGPFSPRGTSVYLRDPAARTPPFDEVVRALHGGAAPPSLRVARGRVERDSSRACGGAWRIAPPEERRLVVHVRSRAPLTFGDVAHVRVGVKTTADAVFVRDRFDDLPPDVRPEPELVRPLLRREHAAPFVPLPGPPRALLYPHTTVHGKRGPVDLDRYPRARAWLERHRPRLEAREYVREAGRRWYEVWVPHDPDGWSEDKVVFPDIAERPRFFLDRSGAVVPGNCYWATARDRDPRVLPLLLAVANSTLALRYYDATCGNRLYHGRRRFITQYVQRFPLPDPDGETARELIERVRERLERGVDPRADVTLDRLVSRRLSSATPREVPERKP